MRAPDGIRSTIRTPPIEVTSLAPSETMSAGYVGIEHIQPSLLAMSDLPAILPALIVLLAICHDLNSRVAYPRCITKLRTRIASPFRNYLGMDDLDASTLFKPKHVVPSWQKHSLTFAPLFGAVVIFGGMSMDVSKGHLFPSRLSLGLAWLYVSLKFWMKPPATPPYMVLFFFIASLCLSSSDIFFAILHQETRVALIALSVFLFSSWSVYVLGTLPMSDTLPSAAVASPYESPTDTKTMPEDNITLWQWCTFSFVEPMLQLASLRRLEYADVWALSPFYQHKILFEKYLCCLDRDPGQSLLRFFISSSSLEIIIDIVSELWAAVGGFGCVYALQRILFALETSPDDKSEAYFYAFVTFLLHLSFAQVDVFQEFFTRRSYERVRGMFMCALHFKALRRRDLSGSAHTTDDTKHETKNAADLGKIVNLMQGDSYMVSWPFWHPSNIVAATVRVIISLIYLHQVLGWSSMAGLVVVVVAYCLNIPVAKWEIYITRKSWKAKDKRMSSVNELFQNIRFLKFYGWENHWSQKVLGLRESELRWRIAGNVLSATSAFIWTLVPSAMAFFSFFFYTVVAKQHLTVSKTFASLSLFSLLQGPLLTLPDEFFRFLHAYVSYKRIDAFMREDEVPTWASTIMGSVLSRISEPKIGFENASFQWSIPDEDGQDVARFALGPLGINFPIGKLSLITGTNGSGKTALLLALLGELHCTSGRVYIDKTNHRVAYCGQNPCENSRDQHLNSEKQLSAINVGLEHATIRDNVIFGSARGLDERRYEAVLDASALRPDLAIFEAGDMTEIGEKGVTLSGGQRARVALARALYSDAKLILLDDPLAAVDMHTAQHLLENYLCGALMNGRTVILATHHLSLCLPKAAYLVKLAYGNVDWQGNVRDVQNSTQLVDATVAAEDVKPIDQLSPIHSPGAEAVTNEADMLDGTEPGQSGKAQETAKGSSKGKLVEAEHRAEGRVSVYTYLTYIRAAGWIPWLTSVCFMIFLKLISVINTWFLAKWSEAFETGSSSILNSLAATLSWPLDTLPSPVVDTKPWLMVYLWFSVAGAMSMLLYISLGYYSSWRASRALFSFMLKRLVRAPPRFFDTTPMGRILNRFTSDMNTVDSSLQSSLNNALNGCLSFLASFFFIISVIPHFAPFAIFIAWFYIRLAPSYVRAARDLRRLESVGLSPAFAGFDELLRGITHIRAFGMEKRYQEAFYKKIDLFQGFDHVYWLVSCWLSWRYDCLGSVVVFATTIFALWSGVSDAFAAIVIVQAGVFADASRQLVRVLAQLELDFNSVERIGEYSEAPQEAPAIIESKRPPAYWPTSSGSLEVKDLVIRYAPDLPAVLNNISFSVNSGEKIGVVGRTGSGKSTLALSLFRMVEPSQGSITLDGIDLASIGLEDLRKKITIVSQDVALFNGTIRSNLDPLEEHDDQECLAVMERCHLKSREGRTQLLRDIGGLDTPISATGSFSAGERQLVALARAILRGSQVVVLDEATSQIDTAVDDEIQRTIREELAHAMVITIAHRLKTIIDYDRILVLGEGGRIVEFDTPGNLVNKPDSVFGAMCKKSSDWPELKKSLHIEGRGV